MRQLLSDRAGGMFVWVRVWLQILLPTHNRQKTVFTVSRAQRLLTELDASKNNTQDEQLKTAYQRLWTQNEYKDFVKTRRDLFRFVLCWLAPLEIDDLTDILRVDLDHKGLYNESLTEDWVRTLGADFLTIDPRGKITFVHDSARHFVCGLVGDGQQSPNAAQLSLFQSEESHRQVMRLFNTLFGSPGQPVHDYELINSLGWYFERHLPAHCDLAVLDPLVVDSSWEMLFDETSSTFHAWLVSGQPCKTRFKIPPEFIQNDSVSCKAALLGFPWRRAVSDKDFETLGQDRQYWGEQERYLERRLGGSLDSDALVAAVIAHNRPVLLFLLHGAHRLHGQAVVLELLSSFCDFVESSENFQYLLRCNSRRFWLRRPFLRVLMVFNLFLDLITQREQDAENAAKLETVREQVRRLSQVKWSLEAPPRTDTSHK
ncbi:hypothetical protein IG631_05649 [Alternaria alternata]|nr:hypothetical protein IG631_05649 [Alternaria alternata]